MEQVSEVEMLRHELAEMKAVLGQDESRHVYAKAFGMTPLECSFLGLLMAREVVTRNTFFSTLYSNTPDTPCGHILNVKLTHIRKKLAPHGIVIGNEWGIGWFISPEHKKLIRELCA